MATSALALRFRRPLFNSLNRNEATRPRFTARAIARALAGGAACKKSSRIHRARRPIRALWRSPGAGTHSPHLLQAYEAREILNGAALLAAALDVYC
jgi:hypothetical protein